MAKKSGLGRGLSNLIPGADKTENTSGIQISTNPDYQEISITEIDPNPNQPRKKFNEGELEELAKTIQSVGVIEPVVVRKMGERFQLISGERRWRACRIAGYKKVPAVIKKVDDIQALEMGIIENVQREELNPVEEARAYDYWMKETGFKPSDIADRIGKDRSTVTNLIRLLKLPDEILDLVENRIISAGQARPLIGIADRRVLSQLAKKIATEGWTARRVEDEVAAIMDGGGDSKAKRKTGAMSWDANVKSLEDKIRKKLMSRVQVMHKKAGSGKLIINYANLEDLDRILELMGIAGN